MPQPPAPGLPSGIIPVFSRHSAASPSSSSAVSEILLLTPSFCCLCPHGVTPFLKVSLLLLRGFRSVIRSVCVSNARRHCLSFCDASTLRNLSCYISVTSSPSLPAPVVFFSGPLPGSSTDGINHLPPTLAVYFNSLDPE